MKRLTCLAALCLTSLLLCLVSFSCEKKVTQPQRPPRQIAVIPKGTTHEFWKSIHAGAEKAAQQYNLKIIWKGPLREDDREEQIKVVEDFVNKKVSGIVLAPLDDQALVPA